MNESEFEDFLADAVKSLQAKNDLLGGRHGIGHFARWDHDGELNRLVFSNPNEAEVLVAETTDIGSFSLNTKTWLWAWANKSNTAASREKAAALKLLFDATGMRIFTDPHISCDENLAWELAAASVEQLDGLGCYRGPVGHLWVFWSIDKITLSHRGNE